MSDDLAVDTSKQEISSGYLEFYELELGVNPDPSNKNNTLYFHDGKNENVEDITYDGNTYVAIPILLTGIEIKSDGAMARPTISIANVESIIKSQSIFKTEMRENDWQAEVDGVSITAADFKLDDLVGSRLTRRRTLEKYLNSNPTIEFPKDVYIIDRIQGKNNLLVTFELAAPFDLAGISLPSRTVVGKYCPWKYQGASTELIASDRQGACSWKKSNQVSHSASSSSSVYNTLDDEPIIAASAASSASTGNYNASTSYVINAIVLSGGVYYQSKAGSNQGNAVTNKVFWRILRTYTTWSSDSGSTQYTVDTDIRKNSYVLHDNTTWRVLVQHTKSSSLEPELGSTHWERADVCGKLLESCKMRYQSKGMNNNTGVNYIPSTELSTQSILPFGGFPGSRKFR